MCVCVYMRAATGLPCCICGGQRPTSRSRFSPTFRVYSRDWALVARFCSKHHHCWGASIITAEGCHWFMPSFFYCGDYYGFVESLTSFVSGFFFSKVVLKVMPVARQANVPTPRVCISSALSVCFSSWLTNRIEHLPVCLFSMCKSPSVCPFMSFLTSSFFPLLGFESSLYLWVHILYWVCTFKFSPSL